LWIHTPTNPTSRYVVKTEGLIRIRDASFDRMNVSTATVSGESTMGRKGPASLCDMVDSQRDKADKESVQTLLRETPK
jgi:hypothetical protein